MGLDGWLKETAFLHHHARGTPIAELIVGIDLLLAPAVAPNETLGSKNGVRTHRPEITGNPAQAAMRAAAVETDGECPHGLHRG